MRLQANVVLFCLATAAAAWAQESPEELFQRGLFEEQGLKRLDKAIATYRRVVDQCGDQPALAGRALLRIAACEKLRGNEEEARAIYQKLVASEASWLAGDTCLQTYGGYGFAEEYDIERKFRETRLYQVAPISTNLILSHVAIHVLNLPKSF